MSLAQQWDQLRQMVMRMQHNLEQQIQARCAVLSHMIVTMSYMPSYYIQYLFYRNTIGVSEEQLKEFTASFK